MISNEFPKRSVLEHGIVLGAITNAIMAAQHAGYASYQSWDGTNYVLNGHDGTLGAITVDRAGVVGVFYDKDSPLNPFRSGDSYIVERFLAGLPDDLRSLAENRTLMYNRQNYRGRLMSVVTAAFWSDGEYLTAAFPWEEVLKNGAHIVYRELMANSDDALAEWQDAYGMSPGQVALARSLFERKKAVPNRAIRLLRSEVDWLAATSDGTGDIKVCIDSLAVLGISLGEGSREEGA
jgi:hypothetical protein